MGLDVYLYRYENRERTEQLEKEFDTIQEANWAKYGEYDTLAEEVKTQVRKDNEKIAFEMGLDKWGSDETTKKKIEENHPSYPDHYFKIGYFRSSYNGGGINHILRNLDLPDLYEIFARDDKADYTWQPDWEASLKRCEETIEALKAVPNIRCFTLSPNELADRLNPVNDESEAIAKYIERSKEFREDSEWFSSRDGHFMPKGLKVLAIVEGQRKRLFADSYLPCVYVIHEGDNEWYIQALEIVRDTIKFVLGVPDKDKYFLHWSS